MRSLAGVAPPPYALRMALRLYRRRMKVASSPGVPVHFGEERSFQPAVSVITYGPDGVDEFDMVPGADPPEPTAERPVVWIDVDGIHDVDLVLQLGEQFGLHPLLLEDVANSDQRPKVEEFEDYLYLVLKMVRVDEAGARISEQISIVLGRGWVISFQEQPGDVFEPVRERIRIGKGRIRTRGADYLCYALADALVDHYFLVLESIAEQVSLLETRVFGKEEDVPLDELYALRAEIASMRRSIWPSRDAIQTMRHTESELIDAATERFLADVYDHVLRVIETLETFRDLASGLVDTQISMAGQRLNEVMKVLTIISTIFIPLSFLAGLYGMNFEVIPELKFTWGYPALLLVMLVIAGGMLLFFRKKRWI